MDHTLFDSSHIVTDVMNVKLTRRLTHLELKGVVFKMGNFKAPGPYGFNPFFFKKNLTTNWASCLLCRG